MTTRPNEVMDGRHDGSLTRREFVASALKLGCSATAAGSLLAACHSKKPHRAAIKFSGRVQILVGFDGGNSASERQVQQALAQAFIAAHPQVGIDFLRATSAATAESQLKALVTRGSAPDIVLGLGLAEVATLADQRLWLDLGPLISRDGVSTGAFLPQAMSAARLASFYGANKAIVGVPLGVHDHALAYNVDLFSKAAVAPPPASWTENSWTYPASFLQAAQALTVDQGGKHAGQAGFDSSQVVQFGVGRVRPESVFYSFGGHLYDGSKRRAQFDTPAAIQGAQFAGDLINRYHVQPAATDLAKLTGAGTGDAEQAGWRAGKLAMIDLCSCELNSPFASKVPFVWKAAALPIGPARRFGPGEVSLGTIVASSGQHDLAWEVLKFLAVEPAHERDLAVGGFGAIPALSSNLNAFTEATKQSVGVDPSVWLAGLPTASTDDASWIPAFAEVHTLFTAALAQVTAGASAATVMPQLQQQAQQAIDTWFKSHK